MLSSDVFVKLINKCGLCKIERAQSSKMRVFYFTEKINIKYEITEKLFISKNIPSNN